MKDLQLCTTTRINLALKAERNRSHVKEFVSHDFIYTKFRSKQNPSILSEFRIVVTLGGGGRLETKGSPGGVPGVLAGSASGDVGVFTFQRFIELCT